MLSYAIVAIVAFIAGGVFGALNEGSVERSINRLKAAEQAAEDTIFTIKEHKNS